MSAVTIYIIMLMSSIHHALQISPIHTQILFTIDSKIPKIVCKITQQQRTKKNALKIFIGIEHFSEKHREFPAHNKGLKVCNPIKLF